MFTRNWDGVYEAVLDDMRMAAVEDGMKENEYFQMKESEYVSKENIGRALEEVSKELIHIKGE